MKIKHLAAGFWSLSLAFAGACGDYLPGSVDLKVDVDYPVVEKGVESELVVRVRVKGRERKMEQRLPLNLAVVLDRSGSMSGAKIEQAKQAAALLVEQLGEEDAFSLVAYDNEVDVVVAPQVIGDKKKVLRRIRELQPGGSTALYEGVQRGAAQLKEFFAKNRVNRVILLSDGMANVGPKSPREISRLGRRLADEGIAVSTVGLGDDYSEDVLASLAEASDANYYYVRDIEGLPAVFEKEFGELKAIVARDLEIEVRCKDGVKAVGFMGRENGGRKVSLRTLASGQERELLFRCKLEGPSGASGAHDIAEVRVRYEDGGERLEVPTGIRVAVSEDGDAVAAAENKDVSVSRDLMQNNLEAEDAIAVADRGDLRGARRLFAEQKAKLGELAKVAPAARQSEIAEELKVLSEGLEDLEAGENLAKRSRKALQSNVFQRKNSK